MFFPFKANVKFVVIGVCPSTKQLQLSDLPHLMGEKRISPLVDDRFQVDEILKMSVEWVLSGSNHVVFHMPREAEADGENSKETTTTTTTTKGFYNESVKNPQKFANKKKVLC